MKSHLLIPSILLSCAFLVNAHEETPDHRLRNAAEVFQDIMATPDKGIPHGLLDKAECIVIVPGMKKAALIVGVLPLATWTADWE